MPSRFRNPSQPPQNGNGSRIQESPGRNGSTSRVQEAERQNGHSSRSQNVEEDPHRIDVPNGPDNGQPSQEPPRVAPDTEVMSRKQLMEISGELLRLNDFITDILQRITPVLSFGPDGSITTIYSETVTPDATEFIWREALNLLGTISALPEYKAPGAIPRFANHHGLSVESASHNIGFSIELKNFSEYMVNHCKVLRTQIQKAGSDEANGDSSDTPEEMMETEEQFPENENNGMPVQQFMPLPLPMDQMNHYNRFPLPLPLPLPTPGPSSMRFPPQMHPIPQEQFGPIPTPMFMSRGMAPGPGFWPGFRYQPPAPYPFHPNPMYPHGSMPHSGPGLIMRPDFFQNPPNNGFFIPQPNGHHPYNRPFESMGTAPPVPNTMIDDDIVYPDPSQYLCKYCGYDIGNGHGEDECEQNRGNSFQSNYIRPFE